MIHPLTGYKIKYKWLLISIVAAHFFLFCQLGIWRHWGYLTSINDLGCFDQAIWAAMSGGSLLNTSIFSYKINWLGFHFNPILYLFTPLYYLIPSVNWLITFQCASLALTAIPIFLLAKAVTGSEKQAFLWAIIYLLNPFLINAAIWDFHPVSLAVPLIATSLLAVENKRPVCFIFSSFFLILCQEHLGITAASLGLLYGLKNHNWKISFFVMGFGAISAVFILGWIMPLLSPTKQHVMFNGNLNQLNRYSWMGHSLLEVVKTITGSPGYIFSKVFFEFDGISYLKNIFLPYLFVSLASPATLLPMSADLLANLLSANPMPRHISSYHSVILVPIMAIAAIYGAQKLQKYIIFFTPSKTVKYIFFLNIFLSYLFFPLPLPYSANFWNPVQVATSYDQREYTINRLIGQESVSVQANLGAHFSQRNEIFRFPEGLDKSKYIIIHLHSPTNNIYSPLNTVGSLHHHLSLEPFLYLNTIKQLISDSSFHVYYWSYPWIIFKRGQRTTAPQIKDDIILKINKLNESWLVSK